MIAPLHKEYIMAATEAQKRANNEYRKRSVRSFNLKFYPSDDDLLKWFEEQPNKAQYLKELIRDDMTARK